MLFNIRFRGQLRRTRPELITSLEQQVAASAIAAGGRPEAGRKVLGAAFDESRICFWLDMVIFIEKVYGALEKAASELFGFTLVLGRDIPETAIRTLYRSISEENSRKSTGIWCSSEVREALEPYTEFGSSVQIEDESVSRGYWEFIRFRSFHDNKESPYLKKIEKNLAGSADKNTVLLGNDFTGKRVSLCHYCAGFLGNVPPLVIRFGTARRSLVYFADAWTEEIRSFVADVAPDALIKDVDDLRDLLMRERLRDEWSPYVTEKNRQFIRSLLTAYAAAAGSRGAKGVLVLEEILQADAASAEIFSKILASMDAPLLVLASDSSSEENLKGWEGVFSRKLKISSEGLSANERADFPGDLWEAAYNIYLLGEYFPASLLPRLFEEEGLNRDVYFRSIQMLEALGVLSGEDPRPRLPNFIRRAEKILGDGRKEMIRSAVRNRILDWENTGKFTPCFNLLKILSDLGEAAANALVLRSIRADVLNDTCKGIEKALAKGYFAPLTGAGNAPVLEYSYKTLKALVWGDEDGIRQVFEEPIPALTGADGKPCYGGCRAQVKTNLASFYLGCRNVDAASETVREAMTLNRDLGKDAVPAYRLFSLVNLSRQRIDDALEYISFAVEQAEKTGQNEELSIACFFASTVNFLYGNISKAARLALRAEKTAAELGQTEWELRARFLRGRLSFEIGRYRDALEIFESLESGRGSIPAKPAMTNTVRAWIFRAGNFLARSSAGNGAAESASIPVPPGPDAALFEIEAAYLAADYKRAADLADAFLASPGGKPAGDFIFSEQPDWRSAFSQCEHLFRGEKRPGTGLALAYRSMAQCALHPSPVIRTGILSAMQRFMRDELPPDVDPNETFYFYAWYCMLRDSLNSGDSRESQIDITTVVSMAFKRLQRRAGRIDDMETRQAFLNLSRWNSTLYLAAREFKLI